MCPRGLPRPDRSENFQHSTFRTTFFGQLAEKNRVTLVCIIDHQITQRLPDANDPSTLDILSVSAQPCRYFLTPPNSVYSESKPTKDFARLGCDDRRLLNLTAVKLPLRDHQHHYNHYQPHQSLDHLTAMEYYNINHRKQTFVVA